MRFVRNLVKTVYTLCLLGAVLIFSAIVHLDRTLPADFKVTQGEELTIHSDFPLKAVSSGGEVSRANAQPAAGVRYDVDLKLFGVIPVRRANVEVIPETYVAVLGQPFGIKIYTEGVLVVGLTDVDSPTGNRNPAKEAGIREGDFIRTVDGEHVSSNSDVSRLISESGGRSLRLVIVRDGKEKTVTLTPQRSVQSGGYKAGLWVRDSSAGIGTLTFYSPASDMLCGLGHGICDVDTGALLSLNSGELVDAEILSVVPGTRGTPGELKGRFTFGTLAKLLSNNETGVYGRPACEIDTKNLVPIALRQEVVAGPAKILTTVAGQTPALYDCTVELRASHADETQNLLVRVTDPTLLSLTGGIVQGMSGSPILQNGRLIGAVTHVLVNDASCGYGIFAETMLRSAQGLSKKELQKAS